MSKQTNGFELWQLNPCRTKLVFKLELISLFTNYSRVIACCFVLLVSLSANQFFSYFELVHIYWFVLSTAAGCHVQKANCVTLLVRSGGQSLTSLRVYLTARSQIALSAGVCSSFSAIRFFFSHPYIWRTVFFSPIVTARCPLWNHRSMQGLTPDGSPVSSATWRVVREHRTLSIRAREHSGGGKNQRRKIDKC